MSTIFCAVYSALQCHTLMGTPNVGLAVQSSFQQILHVAVKKAVCNTHRPRATHLWCIKRTDNMKPYAQVKYLNTWLSLVNWCAIQVFCACNGICLGVETNVCMYNAHLLYCHNFAVTIVMALQHAWIAKVVIKNEKKWAHFLNTIAWKC